jgi:hypothetical protein
MHRSDPRYQLEGIMTRELGSKGRSLIRALAAAMVVVSLFGFSALAVSAQDGPEVDVPTPLEACQEALPDGVSVSDAVAEALAESDLPPEVVDDIIAFASQFDLTCEDLFGSGDDS